jgi:ureidoglycolate dehydrogenase (NAD+)
MTAATPKIRLSAAELTGFAEAILEAGGYAPPFARETADLLVWANARGIDSHGVLRIPRYLEMVREGQIKGNAEPHLVSSFGAMAIMEGDFAPGAAAMNLAMDRAVALARQHAIGWCSTRNITHAGAVGYFAEKAAARDCIGIVMTASKPLMTYYGSSAEALSTNPLAIAAPNPKGGHAIILDMSTSAAALGKIMAAKEAGRSIPVGWGIDAKGSDTTDPKAVRTLLPMAGAKGSGLSLMIEVLGSVLIGNPIITTSLNGTGKASFNGIAMAIDIRAFGDVGAFYDGMAELAAAIKALPPAAGAGEILLPGERGAKTGEQCKLHGVAIEAATARKLATLAVGLGVTVPVGFR